MKIPQKKYLRRKELAEFLEISVGVLVRNEVHLGLDKARCDINKRLIRYNTEIVVEQLQIRWGKRGDINKPHEGE